MFWNLEWSIAGQFDPSRLVFVADSWTNEIQIFTGALGCGQNHNSLRNSSTQHAYLCYGELKYFFHYEFNTSIFYRQKIQIHSFSIFLLLLLDS